jgi:adenosylhomocysteine nucleosidase
VIKKTMICLFALVSNFSALAADTPDRIPRTAVISAYEPELRLMQAALKERKTYTVSGINFDTGSIEGKPVVLFLSGVSMVNAAMTSQLALDHFAVTRVIFTGIAGGVDPNRNIGDVVVAERWSEYLEAIFAREQNGLYVLPSFADRSLGNYGMIFPQPVEIVREGQEPDKRFWFPVDPSLLSTAREMSSTVRLNACTAENKCLQRSPRVVVGGNGVSGQAFVDNAGFREYVFRSFNAAVLDMESAAVAQVAYVNRVPFIVFRSLSDLAGGGQAPNEEEVFEQLASDNSAMVVKAFLRALP